MVFYYPTLEDFRELAADHHGCDPDRVPFRDNTGALADSALGAIHARFGHDPYPNPRAKIAVVGYRLVRNHPLVDANKRSALDMMNFTADANGYRLEVGDQDTIYEVMLAAAAGEMSQDDFIAEITARLEELQFS